MFVKMQHPSSSGAHCSNLARSHLLEAIAFVKMQQDYLSVCLYFLCSTMKIHPEITISNIISGLPNIAISDR
jgi:hypothetical protein